MAGLLLLVACTTPRPVAAQSTVPARDSLPGRTLMRVTSARDTGQSFAMYLPSHYSRREAWPALFVMDPRGRAMFALQLFAAAAERHGFVVLSSYNTLSDGAIEPNIGAINAMLAQVEDSLSIDLTRLYVAGFSGTARLGGAFAEQAPKNFAGLLSAGAAPDFSDSASMVLLRTPGFALALTAGSADFNWAEVRDMALRLEREQVPAQVEYFAGPHAWPPPAVIDRALVWFKLRGMLDGRWLTDSGWVSTRIGDAIRRADSLEKSGQWMLAADAFSEISRIIARRSEAAGVSQRVRELDERPAVAAIRRRLQELARQELLRVARTDGVLSEFRKSDHPDNAEVLGQRLDIASLKQLSVEGDSLQRPWASRLIAHDAVFLGFYEPRHFLEIRQPARAVTLLQAYAMIAPWSPQHCAMLLEAAKQMPVEERARAARCTP